MATKVKFYITKEDNEVIAFFPENKWKHDGLYDSYQHIGQHSPCNIDFIKEDCRPATKEEYEPLLKELINKVGYNDLKVLNK